MIRDRRDSRTRFLGPGRKLRCGSVRSCVSDLRSLVENGIDSMRI